jgi:hypothetical protein
LDKDKAIAILNDILAKGTLKNQLFYELFVYLNLAILWFEKGEFHNAIRSINKLYIHSEYKKTDNTLKFKIAIAELIIRYELMDFDFLETRMRQVKKQFKEMLAMPEHQQEKVFLSILSRMITTPQISQNKKLLTKINQFCSEKSDLNDTEIISYSTWLMGKIKKA